MAVQAAPFEREAVAIAAQPNVFDPGRLDLGALHVEARRPARRDAREIDLLGVHRGGDEAGEKRAEDEPTEYEPIAHAPENTRSGARGG